MGCGAVIGRAMNSTPFCCKMVLSRPTSALRSLMLSRNAYSTAFCGSRLIVGVFSISLALLAYLSALSVSSKLESAGETHAIM